MALVVDGELVCTALPNGVVVHETDDKDLAPAGLNDIVAPVFRPDLIGRQTADASQIKCVHTVRYSAEVVPDVFP